MSQTGRPSIYPWRRMDVGDSFLARCDNNSIASTKLFNTLTSCLANARRKTGFRFRMERCVTGIRVWRIK